MTDAPSAPRPGYQGSETSGVEITIYTKPRTDPVLQQVRGSITFTGKRAADDDGSVVACSVQKSIGSPSGTWSFTVRPSRSNTYPDLRQLIADDDWVDIVFTRHGRKWHVMRGMVDEVRRIKTVGGSGATTTQYLITGRDFGRVWEGTPIWFNRFRGENVGGALGIRIFSGVNFTGTVTNTVKGILFGFLDVLGNLGRATWEPPSGVPNTVSGNFAQSVVYEDSGFTNDPVRYAINPGLMDPQGAGCWELAKEWSDPMFCELWCDLFGPNGGPIIDGAELPLGDTAMGVVLRDIPYINLVDQMNSPWFALPMFTIPRQAVVDHDIGRSGLERYNAFFVGPQVNQDFGIANMMDIAGPLWDKDDIFLHGLRRFDVDTHYATIGSDLLTLTTAQRAKVRDWYCINPYLYNGSLALGRGFPEIRIGTRVRIPGEQGEVDQETYYVETVGHAWQFGQGARTNLGVTRGWIGSDNSLLDAIGLLAGRYEEAPRDATGPDFIQPK